MELKHLLRTLLITSCFAFYGNAQNVFDIVLTYDNSFLLSQQQKLEERLADTVKIHPELSDTVLMMQELLKSKVLLYKEDYAQYVSFVADLAERYEKKDWLMREYSNGLALSYYNLNLFDLANEWNNIYRKLDGNRENSEGRINLNYIQPGHYYYKSGNYAKAIREFKRNFKEVENNPKVYDHYKGNVLNNIAVSYSALDSLDSSRFYIEKAREYWSKNSPELKKDSVYLQGLLDGNLAQVEFKAGNYRLAKDLAYNDVRGSKSRNIYNYLFSKSLLLEICLKLNEKREAEAIYNSFAREVDSLGYPEVLYFHYLKSKYVIEKSRGEYEKALKTFEEMYDLKISEKENSEIGKRERIAALYDVLTKDKRIKQQDVEILKAKKIESENERLQWLVISLVLFVVLAFITGWLILRLKNRKIEAEREIQAYAQEKMELKDLMMAEMHHRIKNNLQTVSGLFRMQIIKNPNKEVQDHLKRAVSRVNSITEIHNLVYEDGHENGVNAKKYLHKIIERIKDLYMSTVDIQLDVDDIFLASDQSVPLGLLLNELVTNSVKYAFFQENSPLIKVKLYKKSGKIVFYYSDNGPGYTNSVSEDGGLGLTLIDLMAKQLRADKKYLVPTQNEIEFIF